MVELVGLAACCAAAFVWLLARPATAQRRLSGLLVQEHADGQGLAERLLLPVLARMETIRERRRIRQRWREGVIELCDGMASELAAGRTPDEAFAITAALLDPYIAERLLHSPMAGTSPTDPDLTRRRAGTDLMHARPGRSNPPAVSTLVRQTPASYESPVDRLEELALQQGAEGLRLLAACWRIGAERGGTLATVLDGLVAALRDEEAQRQEIATQLAGPRATARLLAGLPLLGLGMAVALGADPLAFLFGTLPGLGCLLSGIGLNVAGLWWTRRLAHSAAEPR
ncbi:type II secretion system F family protein [Actinomadura sp. 9N407]|uniref:type II secretion system F family protein n=1 Tax=Actinomadura sp. 9N407 TaxID=3375154 RepID=UPI0037AF61F7